MAEFRKVSAHKKWVIGSLESDTGSEYLFGYDPEQGLMWLERPGHEYSSSDAVWKEAEAYIRQSSLTARAVSVEDMMAESVPSMDPEEQYVVSVSSNGDERPRTVTRSVMGSAPGGGFDTPQPGDPRIVGDFSDDGVDYSEDDIAAQAADFLANLGEGE